jgi:hypothetical protein
LRLTDVRGFARHVANLDPKTEVPRVRLLPGLKRARPYSYSDAEVEACWRRQGRYRRLEASDLQVTSLRESHFNPDNGTRTMQLRLRWARVARRPHRPVRHWGGGSAGGRA